MSRTATWDESFTNATTVLHHCFIAHVMTWHKGDEHRSFRLSHCQRGRLGLTVEAGPVEWADNLLASSAAMAFDLARVYWRAGQRPPGDGRPG